MRIVAAVLLVLAGMGRAVAASDRPRSEFTCYTIDGGSDGSVVVASTELVNVARRYELKAADRICRRRHKGQTERLRSFEIVGTGQPDGPARNRALLGREDRFIDVDTSTAISVMVPETAGTPAYACYRFLSDTPAARLCIPSDLDGGGDPSGKSLFCNRGRCRPRNVLSRSAVADLYEGAAAATVTLPDGTTVSNAVESSVRTGDGELKMTVVIAPRDSIVLTVRLEADGRWRFVDGVRQTGVDPPVSIAGDGHGSSFRDLVVSAELTSAQGVTSLQFHRQDSDDSYGLRGCYHLRLQDGSGAETTIRLPLVVSSNGLGATRPTTEVASDGSIVDLAAGVCAVTARMPPPPSPEFVSQLACVIPSGDSDVRLFGAIKAGFTGAGEFAVGPAGRAGTWTATPCPTS